MVNLEQKISELTVGELLAILSSTTGTGAIISKRDAEQSRVVYGIKGLANLLGVSETQAKRIKASGILNGAIAQRGRTIITNADEALKLWAKGTSGRYSF